MNWPLVALIASLALNILWIVILYFQQSRIDALAGEVERLRGVKSDQAGA